MEETLPRKKRDSAQQQHRAAGPHQGCGLCCLVLGSVKGEGGSHLIYHTLTTILCRRLDYPSDEETEAQRLAGMFTASH